MLDEADLTGKTSNEFQGDLNPIACREKVGNFIFSIFGKVFRTKYHRRISVKTQMIYEIVTNIIIALQVNSLVWYPNLGISNWSSYKAIWMALSYSSYDNICASFYIMNFCFYGTSSLIGLCLALFGFFGIFLKLDKPIPILLIMIFEKIIWILGTICFIPSIMILLMTLKYSTITAQKIDEYSADINSDSLNYGPAGIIIVICCFCILAPIIIFSEIFSCDIKHINSTRNIKARACAEIDLEKKIFYVVMCVFYITFGNPNVALLQILALVYSFYLMIKSILYLPYYNIFENCIESCKMAAISLSLLIFLFGRLLDNGTVIVNFNIFLQPLTLYLVYRFIKRRCLKIKENIETPINQYEFELKFRHLLGNPNLEEKIQVLDLFKKFSEITYFQKGKLFAIWEFNFYFYVIKDQRLARVKLSKIKNSPSSLEGDIQEWKIFNWLSTSKCIVFPDISYLMYLRELSRIKAKDEELCYILIDLQSELSQRVSRIEKIIHLVHKISANISCIKKGYKNIIDKYKTIETFELYAGFLENILSNYNEADHIINRKNGISEYNQRNEDKRLEKYGKEVATMLISCSDESFGSILYINEKAIHILKTSLIPSQELKFTNFLPAPYDSFHTKLAKNFLSKCNTTELEDHKKLFFQDQQGYLIECNLLIKLTALHDSAYFLVSFQQKKIDHQVAIVSEEGIITAHTELFSYYIGKEQKSLKNQNLSDLVPLFCIEKMKNHEPWIIFWENRELAFIKVLKKIKSISVYILIVAYKEEEITKWKTGEAQENFDMISDQDMDSEDKDKWEKEKKKSELTNLSIGEINFLHKITDKTETDIFTQNIDSSIIKDPREHERHHSEDHSKHILPNKSNLNVVFAKKLLIGTRRRIRILQWVLFFVILSGITTVIAIAAYMVVDVSHSLSMSAFNRMGRLLYDIVLSSDYARSIERQAISKSNFSSQTENLEFFSNIMKDLENIQKYLLSDFSKWSYCSNTDILVKPYIPIWLFHEDQFNIIYENLYDTISRFIITGNSFVSEIKSNTTHEDNARFLMINGLGYTWDYLNITMTGIVDCEVNRVKSTGMNIKALLYLGFSTLGVLVLIVIGFIILVSRKHDEYWNFILNNAQPSLVKLKIACIDRLITTHGVDYSSETASNAPRIIKKTIKTKIYKSYMIRLMIFLGIGASYYLLLQLYLYPKCETMMINRPKFINTFNLKRSLLSRLLIFSRDIYSPYFIGVFNKNYAFPSSKIMLETTAQTLYEQVKLLRNHEFMDLMSDELKSRAFEHETNSTLDFSKYGVESAIIGLISEIISISHIENLPSFVPQILVTYSVAIQTEIGQEFDLADRDSKRFIEGELKIIIDVMIIYSSAMCALFFLYYLPYLNHQISNLKKFAVLPIILSMEAN